MSEFIHHMLVRHVSDLTGPSSGAFYKLYLQIWYVVISVLLDTSSRYEVVGRTCPQVEKSVYFRKFSFQNFVLYRPERIFFFVEAYNVMI